MTNTSQIIILSIEPVEGKAFQHGFHLGTDLALAKEIAEEKFHARNKYNMPTRTVALFRGKDMIDVYDGVEWSSDYDANWDDDGPAKAIEDVRSDLRQIMQS